MNNIAPDHFEWSCICCKTMYFLLWSRIYHAYKSALHWNKKRMLKRLHKTINMLHLARKFHFSATVFWSLTVWVGRAWWSYVCSWWWWRWWCQWWWWWWWLLGGGGEVGGLMFIHPFLPSLDSTSLHPSQCILSAPWVAYSAKWLPYTVPKVAIEYLKWLPYNVSKVATTYRA